MRPIIRSTCKAIADTGFCEHPRRLHGIWGVGQVGSNSDLGSLNGLVGALRAVQTSEDVQLCMLVAPHESTPHETAGLTGQELAKAFTALHGLRGAAQVTALDLCFCNAVANISTEALQAISHAFPRLENFNLCMELYTKLPERVVLSAGRTRARSVLVRCGLELPVKQQLASLLPNLQHFGYYLEDIRGGLDDMAKDCNVFACTIVKQRPGRVTSIHSCVVYECSHTNHLKRLCGQGLKELSLMRGDVKNALHQAAPTLVSLNCDYGLLQWAAQKGLSFPQLKHLVVHNFSDNTDDHTSIQQYLGLELETLKITAAVLPMMSQIRARHVFIDGTECEGYLWLHLLAAIKSASVQRITLLNSDDLNSEGVHEAMGLSRECCVEMGYKAAPDLQLATKFPVFAGEDVSPYESKSLYIPSSYNGPWPHQLEFEHLIFGSEPYKMMPFGSAKRVEMRMWGDGHVQDREELEERAKHLSQIEEGCQLVLVVENLLMLLNVMRCVQLVRAALGPGQHDRVKVIGGWPSHSFPMRV